MRTVLTIAAFLALVNGGFMLVDGSRALVSGDYFTPNTGRHAGRLGPWATLLERLGLDPRSTAVKSAFIVVGLATVVAVIGHFLGATWARPALFLVAVAGLWYLPFGTLISVLLLVALALQR